MLTISERAADLLTEARSQQGIPDDAMLRVAAGTDGTQQGISLGFVDQPHEGDQTGNAHGLDICVAPDVAEALDAAQIDVDGSGDRPQLVLVPAT